MPIPEGLRRAVWVRDGGCCAICRERVFFTAEDGLTSTYLGAVAHIVADSEDGPRGVSSLTPALRNREDNLLLLCLTHHAEIDSRPDRYSVERLQQTQREHMRWVATRLTSETPWRSRLQHFFYLNVPRLQMASALAGMSLDLSSYGEILALHELGWQLNAILAGFRDLLERVELRALPLVEALQHGSEARGLAVSFDMEFRTKNIRMPKTLSDYKTALSGDSATDPQLYAQMGHNRVRLVIDPRWVTTTTAFVHFRPSGGKGTFAGLGLVNHCTDREVTVTPLVIGLPSNPFVEALFKGV